MRKTPDAGRKRFDLSVPQVAGSALAAVVAAKLASYAGVYGTILGAGVVSVVATCGGTLFQHFFKRTGEQLRERTAVAARPQEQAPPPPGGFGEGTVYRARGRRRPLVAAALVFGVTMAGITTYELVSGNSFSGGRGTTVSDAVTGRSPSSSAPDRTTPRSPSGPAEPSAPSSDSSRSGWTGSGDTGTAHSATPAPSGSPDTEPSGTQATPAPTPSASAPTTTPPGPSASSRSGTAVPGQDGPAAP
ncbi:hypothetical protein AB0N17_42925 [Streptomyces sp. NPDC051133]|uniref:hypothetical protein n=1 Tax=Streptomyces sp. NPDC051133 TaxID=3155521 RepID=UPI00344539E8